jgi:uncharacterized protein
VSPHIDDSGHRARKIEMLVLQATPFCNLDCSYCYLPNRASKARMTEDTLRRAFECVFTSPYVADQITILWHAGEPLALGVPYYERALAIADALKPPGLTINHNFQTNGTLLDQNWATFLKSISNLTIGVSIDGPAHLHDAHRMTRRKTGSFERVMRGIRTLQQNRIPFHVITVLTRESLRHCRELFDFYVANELKQIAFNIEEIEGGHESSSLHLSGIDTEIKTFFREFIDLDETLSAGLEVREFVGALASIASSDNHIYGNPLAQPLRIVSIGVDGDISTFSPELLGYGSDRHGQYVFGNVRNGGLSGVLSNPSFVAVSEEIDRGLLRCETDCDYFDMCRGGAPANKLFENGTFDSTETLFCRLTKKAVIDVVLDRMERALELA